ncbi:MAG TPA: hypothetical protein HPP87_04750 [Planctomycetes bacterium]|nr:hypothetical protein [Planctomycetota bacterium]
MDAAETLKLIEELGGETVIYRPRAGGSREVTALVDRDRPGGLGNAPHGESGTAEILVANSSEIGIAASEVNRGGDRVEMVSRLGRNAVVRPIKRILAHDGGGVRLEIR